MKILFDNGSEIAISEAKFNGHNHYVLPDDCTVDIRRVYDVQGKSVSFVRCSGCGEIIPNTKIAKEKHRHEHDGISGCLKCCNIEYRTTPSGKRKFMQQPDGGFKMLVDVQASCNRTWRYDDLTDERVRQNCPYRNCASATFEKVENFFDKYPHAFDAFATVDSILAYGYKAQRRDYNGHITYTLKGKYNIDVVVNRQGLVTKLNVSKNRHNLNLRYSKRYDKLFLFNGREWERDWTFSQDFIDEVHKRIKKLYV